MTRPLNIDSTNSRSATQPAQCPRVGRHHRQSDKLSDRQMDRQTGRQADRQAGRQIVTDKQAVRQKVSNLVFYAHSTSTVIQEN